MQTSDTPRSPLLGLPDEIKSQILSYLKKDFKPSLMLLRRTHSTFRRIILAEDCIGTNNRTKRRRMLAAEHKYRFLFAPNHYPCYGSCLKVLEGTEFDEYPFENFRFSAVWAGVGAKARPLGAIRAFERRCDYCRICESRVRKDE